MLFGLKTTIESISRSLQMPAHQNRVHYDRMRLSGPTGLPASRGDTLFFDPLQSTRSQFRVAWLLGYAKFQGQQVAEKNSIWHLPRD
jgi:hypothetical protein